MESLSTGETKFSTAESLVEMQRLWQLLQSIEDAELRDQIVDQISRVNATYRPAIDDYLSRHPESRTHEASLEWLHRFDHAD